MAERVGVFGEDRSRGSAANRPPARSPTPQASAGHHGDHDPDYPQTTRARLERQFLGGSARAGAGADVDGGGGGAWSSRDRLIQRLSAGGAAARSDAGERSGSGAHGARSDGGAGRELPVQALGASGPVGTATEGSWGGPSSGSPLDSRVRSAIQPLVGADLGGVRVHSGSDGQRIASSYGADAVTSGNHVALGSGVAGVDDPRGRFAIAHELTHVAQQSQGRAEPLAGAGGGSPSTRGSLEKEADRVGSVAAGVPAPAHGRGGESVAAGPGGRPAQRGLFSWIGDAVNAVGGAISSAVSWVGKGISTVFGAIGKGIAAAASWTWDAIKTAGGAVWNALKEAGSWIWEKIELGGGLVMSFIQHLPERLVRLAVDGFEAMKGVLGWIWTGLKGAASWAWDGISKALGWVGKGIQGALQWIADAAQRGLKWAIEFIEHPSLEKLWEGIAGAAGEVWEGLKGLAKWGADGAVGAAQWLGRGAVGFGEWVWDGIKKGWKPALEMLLHVAEVMGVGEGLEFVWGMVFRTRPLTQAEKDASKQVHPAGLIPLHQIRVADNSLISKIASNNTGGPTWVTTMHVIHAPPGPFPLDVVVHELTHVAQYEKVGAIYMPQAIHAQGGADKYNYTSEGGVISSLPARRARGQKFRNLNREQQAEVCQEYYQRHVEGVSGQFGASEADLLPWIQDMQRGEF